MDNQEVTADEIRKIRGLGDFDLIMLISETHAHGWAMARRTLAMMEPRDMARVRELRKNSVKSYSPRTWKDLREYLTYNLDLLNKAHDEGLDDKATAQYLQRHLTRNKEDGCYGGCERPQVEQHGSTSNGN